ncbi:LMIP protein, partial [Amia calva]|nr:LMIP protein [Amia calva]
MQYRYSGSAASQGLWRYCINQKCHSHTITVAFWDATRAFMLLAVLSCFAGVVLGLSAFTNGAKSRRVRTGGIALLLSGFLALLALSIYTGVTVHFFGKRFLDWRFSWSYILGWVAIILAFAAGTPSLCYCLFLSMPQSVSARLYKYPVIALPIFLASCFRHAYPSVCLLYCTPLSLIFSHCVSSVPSLYHLSQIC